jgi:predicted permease
VIGIMPPGADVMDNRTEIWTPLGLNPGNRQNRGSHFLYLIGRLKDGVTPDQAQTRLKALIQNWGERVNVKQHVFSPLPATEAERKSTPGAGHLLEMTQVQEQIIGSASRAIWVLQAAVGFVLLIACANLANLLLARAIGREREMAVRRALGASQGRLVAQLLAESLVLSLAGAALGVALASVFVKALLGIVPAQVRAVFDVGLDLRVLAFTLVVSCLSALLFGLAPALSLVRAALSPSLREGSTGTGASRSRRRLSQTLVASEIALSIVLLIGASLLLRSFSRLSRVQPGFETAATLTFEVS